MTITALTLTITPAQLAGLARHLEQVRQAGELGGPLAQVLGLCQRRLARYQAGRPAAKGGG